MRTTSSHGRTTLTFRPSPPLDADLTLQRYRLWGTDPAAPYEGGVLHRVTQVAGVPVAFRLTATGAPSAPRVTVTWAGADRPAIRAAVRGEARRLLGEDADLGGFYRQAARDPVLAPLLGPLRGLRPSLTSDPLEMLVGAISAQQVNLPFAFATRARLVRRLGQPAEIGGVTVYAFPSAAALARADVAALRAMQFSTRKAEYIVGLARAVADGRLDLDALGDLSDDEVIARLTSVRGLGPWTAEWFLARGLGRPDVCPAGDLGVRRAVEAFCFHGRPRDAAAVRRRAAAWRPYRSLAVHYLLAGLRLSRRVSAATRRRLGSGPSAGRPAGRRP